MTDEHGPDVPENNVKPLSQSGKDALANVDGMIRDAVSSRKANGPTLSPADKYAQDSIAAVAPQRRYLPTLADLIDRMTICQLKAIHIPEHAEDYRAEIDMILHDIDAILSQWALDAEAVRAIAVLMLTNHFIWINESKARAGGSEQDHLLRATHSINGVRNTAKNVIASKAGGRKDYKIDAFAADLPPEFKNWNIFQS